MAFPIWVGIVNTFVLFTAESQLKLRAQIYLRGNLDLNIDRSKIWGLIHAWISGIYFW